MTIERLAAALGADLSADKPQGGAIIQRVSSIEDATPESVVFAQDASALLRACQSNAGLILARSGVALEVQDARVLRVRDPKLAFTRCSRFLAHASDEPQLLHADAIIAPTASIGEGTRVGAGAVIEAGVVIGAECTIGSRATICRGTVLGARVVVQAGAVLGATGFGYVRDPENGSYMLFPQQGKLVVEDDVEVGANTTIDRGALGATRIGRGTKIDNLVHIGHNCIIGANVLIAAQVGLSGSCVIGDGAILAGQVGLSDHVTIGPGVIIGGQGGVFVGKTITGSGEMFAGTPAEPLKDYLKSLARLRRLK
jgi:UDP-3-O-[3-hydroxymyristoyl] glucosamine N-acyltransferase